MWVKIKKKIVCLLINVGFSLFNFLLEENFYLVLIVFFRVMRIVDDDKKIYSLNFVFGYLRFFGNRLISLLNLLFYFKRLFFVLV